MDRLKLQTIREFTYFGAVHGAVFWTVYAVIEWLFSTILVWMTKSNYDYIPKHWGFTILLFLLYPVIGLIIGGLSGMGIHLTVKRIQPLQRVESSILFPVIAIFAFILIFNVHLVVQYLINNPWWGPNLPFKLLLSPLCISLLIIFGLVLIVMSNTKFRWHYVCVNTWTVSFLLLGMTGISREIVDNNSWKVKAGLIGLTLVYPVIIFLLTVFIRKMVEKRFVNRFADNMAVSPARARIFLIPIVLFIVGISFFLKQAPLQTVHNIEPLFRNIEHPNVIMIVMDTVRTDHMSIYGYERDTTPNLKKFSEDATLFSGAIAASDMTLSTHASIFTGMYASQHGAHYDPPAYGGRPLSDKLHTIAEILSEKGYSTMGVVANHGYLSYRFNMNQGFHYYDQKLPVPFLGKGGIQKHYIIGSIRDILTILAPPPIFDQWYRRAEEINREAFTLLNKVKKDNVPFFLFINYMDAHEPYIPPPPFDTFYPGKIKRFTTARYFSLVKDVIQFGQKVTDKEQNHLLSQYDGGIAYIDFNIWKLIEQLKKLGLYENSIIVITSDHGEVFGKRNLFGHGVSVYQDQVHVPLIIKYPNTRKQRVVNEFVSSIDIMPTILNVLGCDIPKELPGQSLLKYEYGEYGKARSVISESFPNAKLTKWFTGFDRVERAIFSGSYKLINSTAGKRELYDLSIDQNEEENLYNSANDHISNELEEMLNQFVKKVHSEADSSIKVDKDTLEHLKALGYIQ